MFPNEMDYIREVIEALVAELGPDNIPDDVDVDGALALLNPDENGDIENASEEENAHAAVEASAEEVV